MSVSAIKIATNQKKKHDELCSDIHLEKTLQLTSQQSGHRLVISVAMATLPMILYNVCE